jgi:hypothetical protein
LVLRPEWCGARMIGSLPPFTVEMLEFDGSRPVPKGRLAVPSDTLEDAKHRGKLEICASVHELRSLGFRVFDVRGNEVLRWQFGDDDVFPK